MCPAVDFLAGYAKLRSCKVPFIFEKLDFKAKLCHKKPTKILEDEMKKMYPAGYGWRGKIYFSLLRKLICLPVFFLWGKEILGRRNIPSQGPFLVVCNHQSFLDFLFVTIALRQFNYVSGFIKAKYYDLPFFHFFLGKMAQIRADKNCAKEAMKVLKSGHPLILFPEGTRTRNGQIGRIYPGIELFANTFPQMPVLPMGISGAFEIWPWNSKFPRLFAGRKITLNIGEPLFFIDFANWEKEFSSAVMREVARLAGKYEESGDEKASAQNER